MNALGTDRQLAGGDAADWGPAPAAPSPAPDQVHVWRAFLDGSGWAVDALEPTLSLNERRRANRFQRERDRQRFVVSRGILRAILARYLAIAPDRLILGEDPRGKPVLAWPCPEPRIHFNASHSDGLALYAIACNRPVGVDLEKVRPISDVDRIIERICAPGERSYLSSLPAADRMAAFFACWTRKEAWVKAHGDGLARPLDGVEVSLVPGEPARLVRLDGDPEGAARWALATLCPDSEYAAALAVRGDGWRLSCWEQSVPDCLSLEPSGSRHRAG